MVTATYAAPFERVLRFRGSCEAVVAGREAIFYSKEPSLSSRRAARRRLHVLTFAAPIPPGAGQWSVIGLRHADQSTCLIDVGDDRQ